MKESIGQAFIINLILFFFGILVLLYFGSINYSKAYKAKNKIINTIEKYQGHGFNANASDADKQKIIDEIYLKLEQGGYQTVVIKGKKLRENCAKKAGVSEDTVVYPEADDEENRRYEFCVIRHESTRGDYYQVITYMRFEVPLVGSLLHPAIFGETAVLYEDPQAGN